MKKIILLLSLTTASIFVNFADVNAQKTYTGLLANMDGLTIGDMANISQTDFQYGTARSMAMAGALSSLGADASTMSTNPAGLGLFQRSEFTFTPLITSQKSKNSATNYQDNTKTSFSIGNMALVSTYRSNNSSGLISFSMGVAYNRITDLNYNTSFFQSSMGRETSIGQYFSDQLSNSGVSLSQLQSSGNDIWYDSNISTDIWGAVLGYGVGLADWSDIDGWNPGWIGEDANVGHYVNMQSRGAIGEYDISVGANISNKIYIGATMGIMNIHQELYVNYSEDYIYADDRVVTGDYDMNYSHYNQTAIINGIGVNFKLGVIYRPIPAFKLSFAVHTPTTISLDREYQAAESSSVFVNKSIDEDEEIYTDSNGNAYFEEYSLLLQDYNEEGWSYNTPTRIIAGASYIIGNRALLSVDYQRDWYNGMRMTSAPTGINIFDYENQANLYLHASNSLRVGGEFKVTPAVALRAGYGFTNSITSSDNDVTYSPVSPVVESTKFFSAGVGFAVSKTLSIDLAYMNHTTYYSKFQLFGIDGGDIYSFDIVRNNFAFTTSFRW